MCLSPDFLERPVQPPGGDAEIGLVRGHVVNSMVLAWQDDVVVLQHLDPGWQSEICMRPLVDLN